MDRLSKNHLNCIGIISISIATLMLILVIVLPIMLKKKKTNDFTEKCSPTVNNTDLWAKFPGAINSTLTHKYEVFNYKTNSQNNLGESNEIEVKSDFTILENITYSNFKEKENGDNIYFNADRTYQYYKGNKENEHINNINMGLFETFETMSYPPLYKIGINSVYYLLNKYFIDSDLFIRELYTYKLYQNITADETGMKTKIFEKVSEEKLQKIFSTEEPYKKYSFKTYSGLFEWIKILNVKEDISVADWLWNIFDLSDEEIYFILEASTSYLIMDFEMFKIDLGQKYECESDDQCGTELLYRQLIKGDVISKEFNELKDYLSLNKLLETNYYPFDKSPEMAIFIEEEYKKNDLPEKNQLESLLNPKSEYCLLYPNNSIYLLYLNKTEYKKYLDLTVNQVNFLSQYFYDYLPRIFFYPKVNTTNNNNNNDIREATVSVEPVAKTFSTIFQEIPEKTYKKLTKYNIYKYLLVETMKNNLKEKFHYNEMDEICPLILQKVLDDGKKVNKICSDINIGFNDEEGLYEWVKPYYCFDENKDEKKCNSFILYYLKELVYISDDEINQIFSEDSLGGVINHGMEAIKEAYQCGDKCDDNDYLLKLQFWKGLITRNAPDPLPKTNTIKNWFDDEIPYPVEISYYQQKYGNTDEFSEEDIDFIISLLYENDNDNAFDLQNSNSFAKKLELEKKYSLYMNNNEETSLIKLVNFLFDVFVYKENIDNIVGFDNKEKLFIEYNSVKNLIQGNNNDDKIWIDYLSSGNYFNNFKPNLEKTTGLDVGINLDTKEQENFDFDSYRINTTTEGFEKRRINQMNDLLTLNIKKEEYDYLQNKYINILSPTYNFEKLLGSRIYSDGFQYNNDLKVLYYYDTISSRPLRFKNPSDKKYKKIKCRRFELDADFFPELNEYSDKDNKNALITQKLNKPYIISADFDNLKKFNYNVKDKVDNYICVDPITDMVVDSNINLIYSINTRKFGYLNKNFKNEEIYPVFTYQRKYEIEVESYEDQFPGVTEIDRNMTVFIIFGVLVIVICIVIAVLAFYLLNKKLKQSNKESLKQSLVPLSDSEFKSSADPEAKEVINSNSVKE